MPPALNKALLEWADKAGGADLRKSLNDVLLKHRAAFRAGNSIWAKVSRMMASGENAENQGPPLPEHLRCVNYMTFGELSDVLMELFDNVFPRADANREEHRQGKVARESGDGAAATQRRGPFAERELSRHGGPCGHGRADA